MTRFIDQIKADRETPDDIGVYLRRSMRARVEALEDIALAAEKLLKHHYAGDVRVSDFDELKELLGFTKPEAET